MPGLADKSLHGFRIQIFEARLQAGRRIEGACANQVLFDQVIDQGGVHGWLKRIEILESSTDQFIASPTESVLASLDACLCHLPLHVDQPEACSLRWQHVEFVLGGRDSLIIFPAIFIGKQAEVDIAVTDFIQVHAVGFTIGSRQIFEQKQVEEASEQWVGVNVITQARSLSGEILLNTADEDSPTSHSESLRHAINQVEVARSQALNRLLNGPSMRSGSLAECGQ